MLEPLITSATIRRLSLLTNARGSVPGWLRWLLVIVGWLVIPASVIGADERASFFHQSVEPILRKHCFECHSHSAGQMESKLALDWKSGWETGGERGPAIVPGKPDKSLLIRAIRHDDPNLKMPDEKLSPNEIAILTEWVQRGAFDDRAVAPKSNDAKDWWSLKPLVVPPIPTVASSDQSQPRAGHAEQVNPIDAMVQARLASAGLAPSATASPRDLVRRLYFDLTGLPPSYDEVARFAADPSEQAYQQLVDKLLASPRYGERWARHWFDTIHFADSHGYEHDVGRDHAWPYRDYVINAFNNDLPWSTFIRQQLAVDFFEPNAHHLRPALGFLGAGTFDHSTYSTGPVTFDYLDRDDMLTQTMSAFVSTTANCARCHAHKFDPITQEDYYALQGVFAGIVKGDIKFDVDAQVASRRQQLNTLLQAAKRGDHQALQSPIAQQLLARWTPLGKGADWTPVDLQSFISTEGATLKRHADGKIVAGGTLPETDVYVVTMTSPIRQVTAIRLDLLPHETLPMNGPGRCHNGNLHLSEVALTVFLPGEQSGKPVAIASVSADFNQEGWSIAKAIDGDPKTAWGIHPAVGKPHHGVFVLTQPLALPVGARLTMTLKQLHGGSHLIGAFRLSVTDTPGPQAMALPSEVEVALGIEASKRSSAQQQLLARHFVQLGAESELAQLPEPALVYAAAPSVSIPVGNGKYQPASIPKPKTVHLLHRGDIGKPKGEVPPGALSVFAHLPARFVDASKLDESARRAALADWLAHKDNVLTWRSVVNRVWHYHFGRGLCDTPSDFGRMGGVPSHPELIDWLAVWFRDQAGGSLKKLHRMIVTSQTYRQSAQAHSQAATVDGDNRLLWRQNRLRVDADSYRDFVLAVSGRIDYKMGGPAIQHFHQSPGPQATPKLDYAAYNWSSPGANRRSIYRYVWRGIPDPLMSALDFPDLGLLAPARGNSVSPLQALALYNNNFVLFYSQAMADQIAQQVDQVDKQVVAAAHRAYQREPTTREREELREFTQKHGLAALCRVLINSSEFLFIP